MGYATVGVNMRGTGCSGGLTSLIVPNRQMDTTLSKRSLGNHGYYTTMWVWSGSRIQVFHSFTLLPPIRLLSLRLFPCRQLLTHGKCNGWGIYNEDLQGNGSMRESQQRAPEAQAGSHDELTKAMKSVNGI